MVVLSRVATVFGPECMATASASEPRSRPMGTGRELMPCARTAARSRALGEALRQAKEWLASGLPPVRIAVNVSAIQVQRGRLVHTVIQALQAAAMRPDQLELEITESTLQSEPECLTGLLALRRLGVTLAIDDFGTGYSCLSSLKTLPINRLKIDRAFVRDVPHDPNDAAIVEAIIAMAHKLGLGVVAEGVETVAQEKFLRERGCDAAQGYLYAHPMAPEPMADLLRGQLG